MDQRQIDKLYAEALVATKGAVVYSGHPVQLRAAVEMFNAWPQIAAGPYAKISSVSEIIYGGDKT